MPDVVVHIKNSGSTDALIYPRGEFLLWLPQGISLSAPTIPGAYELHLSSQQLVQNGLLLLKPNQTTSVRAGIMNQQSFYPILKRGDTDLMFVFRKTDGNVFMSDNLPFTEQSIEKNAVAADCAK